MLVDLLVSNNRPDRENGVYAVLLDPFSPERLPLPDHPVLLPVLVAGAQRDG